MLPPLPDEVQELWESFDCAGSVQAAEQLILREVDWLESIAPAQRHRVYVRAYVELLNHRLATANVHQVLSVEEKRQELYVGRIWRRLGDEEKAAATKMCDPGSGQWEYDR